MAFLKVLTADLLMVSPAGVEPATYRLGGGRVHSFFTPYKRKLRGLTLGYVLFSYFKC